jgi:SAM-dependent methyltransferase
MPWTWTPARRDDPELMDAPGLPDAEVADAYRVLRTVNRQLGNLRTLDHELRTFVHDDTPGPGPLTLLDVGSGSGDVSLFLADRVRQIGRACLSVSLDRDPTAARLAAGLGAIAVRGDALRLPLRDGAVDFVTAVKFAHHFTGPALTQLVAELARVARRRVVVLDIRRHWLAYWGFIAWSRVFTRNRLVRYDGPLSVLRGFTPAELTAVAKDIPAFGWTVRSYPGFQLALVGRRYSPTAT